MLRCGGMDGSYFVSGCSKAAQRLTSTSPTPAPTASMTARSRIGTAGAGRANREPLDKGARRASRARCERLD